MNKEAAKIATLSILIILFTLLCMFVVVYVIVQVCMSNHPFITISAMIVVIIWIMIYLSAKNEIDAKEERERRGWM